MEKQRATLNMEMEELSERLDEAGGATAAQVRSPEGAAEPLIPTLLPFAVFLLQRIKSDGLRFLPDDPEFCVTCLMVLFSPQSELNKKREAELQKLKRDLEEQQAAAEQQIAQMKKKSQDQVNELSDQLDQASKNKGK